LKIDFDDKSYIEVKNSDEPGKVIIIISAKDHLNAQKKIINSVEITKEQFDLLIGDVK
jgi:nitrate reductase NapAB chaperone NapD